jgi:hypothetical protein
MCQRYKNWTQQLARHVVMAYNVGKEVGGEAYVERLKEEFRVAGQKSAKICGPRLSPRKRRKPRQSARSWSPWTAQSILWRFSRS